MKKTVYLMLCILLLCQMAILPVYAETDDPAEAAEVSAGSRKNSEKDPDSDAEQTAAAVQEQAEPVPEHPDEVTDTPVEAPETFAEDGETGETEEPEAPSEQAANPYFIYFLDRDLVKLEAESYEPAQEDTEYMLRDLMQLLGSRNADGKGKAVNLLPEDVTINSYELQGEVLVIDFNDQYPKVGRVREILVRAGVVKTFLQVPGIRAVRFTVEGEDLTDSKNQPVGEMTADTFVEYSEGTDVSEYRFDTLILYFTDQSGTVLIPELRNVYYRQNLQKERVVLEQLARGPMVKDHFPTIPGNVAVQSVSVSDGICYVTVDDSFVDYALSGLPEEIPVYSVVNSIIASCGESRVEITAGNNASRVFGESMELYQFYEFNPDLVFEEDAD